MAEKRSFFDYFEDHSQQILGAAKLLKSLFGNELACGEAAERVKDYEHSADNITHDVVKKLHTSSFIPPVLDREDILDFIKTLDDVIDYIDDSVGAFVGIFGLNVATVFAQNFAEVILKTSDFLVRLCPLLRDPARNADEISRICVDIHTAENEGDRLYEEASRELYNGLRFSSVTAAEYVAWSRIYELLETVVDRTEDCANVAESIVVKS